MLPYRIKFIKMDRTRERSAVIESFRASPAAAIAALEKQIFPTFSATMSCNSPKYLVSFISISSNIAVHIRVPQVRRRDYEIIRSLLVEMCIPSSSAEWCIVRKGIISVYIEHHNILHPLVFVQEILEHYFNNVNQHIVEVQRHDPDIIDYVRNQKKPGGRK